MEVRGSQRSQFCDCLLLLGTSLFCLLSVSLLASLPFFTPYLLNIVFFRFFPFRFLFFFETDVFSFPQNSSSELDPAAKRRPPPIIFNLPYQKIFFFFLKIASPKDLFFFLKEIEPTCIEESQEASLRSNLHRSTTTQFPSCLFSLITSLWHLCWHLIVESIPMQLSAHTTF